MAILSKPLGNSDESGFNFSKEMLAGDPTYGINFDRIQWDNEKNGYVIVEYLLCDERQFERGITPHSSHPNKYFYKNGQKFISLWELAQLIGATLYLVNYSKKGTEYENEVLIMEVTNVDKDHVPHVETENIQLGREEFSDWFRKLNERGKRGI